MPQQLQSAVETVTQTVSRLEGEVTAVSSRTQQGVLTTQSTLESTRIAWVSQPFSRRRTDDAQLQRASPQNAAVAGEHTQGADESHGLRRQSAGAYGRLSRCGQKLCRRPMTAPSGTQEVLSLL